MTADTLSPALLMIIGIMMLGLCVVGLICIIACWVVFRKAGKPGWACLVPFYNQIVQLEIVGKPTWWLVLLLIPAVNIIFLVWVTNLLSKSFGKDEGFTILLIFFPFVALPILAWSKAEYEGPYGNPADYQAYQQRKNGGFDFEKK
jgi:hypothetical protein